MKSIYLNGKYYSYWNPYIIAEIGVNHEGKLELAKRMIDEAASAGVHGVKFQTYKADKIASKEHSKYYWDLNEEPSTSQHQLFQKYDAFERKEYEALAKHAKERGVDFLSTPFDLDAIDMLEDLVPFYKIASADITNIPMLKKIAGKGKPVILSTGASTLSEIQEALDVLHANGAKDVCLLHCVLNYPTPESHAHIGVIKTLTKTFPDCSIGYSDHVKPNANGDMPALLLASFEGSVVLEKHFTYDKTLKGNDHYHAMDHKDLKKFCEQLAQYRLLYGNEQKSLENEKRARTNARRRICLSTNVEAGMTLTEDMLIPLRADIGIEVSFWENVIGKKILTTLKAGHPVEWAQLG
jgi:N-acetylneuraminate synthase